MEVKLIVLIVIVLAVIAVSQIMRVYELSSKLRGHREENINLKANNLNAALMMVFVIVFFGSFFYMLYLYGNGLMPEAASEHGQDIDALFNLNWLIVFAVYLITNFLLFFFAYKYAYHPDRKAYYFPHNTKLELIWTTIPAVALTFIIIFGLMTWNKITGAPSKDAIVVEVYAKQFDWTVRYSGEDNQLGYADYKLINGENPLGVVTPKKIAARIEEIEGVIVDNQNKLGSLEAGTDIASVASEIKLHQETQKLGRIKERIRTLERTLGKEVYDRAKDDFSSKSALFLIVGQEYQFVFRSRDVIHSAFFPHFRAQINCVPGMRTSLKFRPIYTTEEMRTKTGNPKFDYVLLCNKICGASHSNMYLPVKVGTAEEFEEWRSDDVNTAMIVGEGEGDEGQEDKADEMETASVLP